MLIFEVNNEESFYKIINNDLCSGEPNKIIRYAEIINKICEMINQLFLTS